MNVREWRQNGSDYNEGVLLYKSYPKANKNIVFRLEKGNTFRNIATLNYELHKIQNKNVVVKKVKPQVVLTQNKPFEKKTEPNLNTIAKSLKRNNEQVNMAMLPTTHLRTRFVEKNKAFYKRWELKLELNNLSPVEEKRALQLIREIMKLTEFIDSVWLEIDYYLEHKKELSNSTTDYSNLSDLDKVKERQRLWSRKSKREDTLKKWILELEGIKDKSKRSQLQSKIEKQKEVIAQMQMDIKTLTKLIDG